MPELTLSLDKLNELQIAGLHRLVRMLKGMHYADIVVRTGAQDHYFEADWLKHIDFSALDETKAKGDQ